MPLTQRPGRRDPAGAAGHFRAHARRMLRLDVAVLDAATGASRGATLVDVSLAGGGLVLDEPLAAGTRIAVSITTPTLWDPLVVPGVVVWCALAPAGPGVAVAAGPSPRARASRSRVGVAFEHPGPSTVLATWEMLATLAYE